MSLLARLESKIGRYVPPNITAVLIAGQAVCLLADWFSKAQGNPGILHNIQLVPARVVQGEVWRVVTYLFAPMNSHPLFIIFLWFLFYLMGTTLQANWGTVRYNTYLLIGYVASLLLAFVGWAVFPGANAIATNGFLYGSVFLAFARLYPDFTLLLMFILPVKVKWLALLMWLMYGYSLLFDSWLTKLMVVAAVANYLLFFGRDIWRDMKHGHRRMQHQGRLRRAPARITHECRVCGLTSVDSPRTPFRYCSQCEGQCCYCPDHLRDHEHVVKERAT